MQTATPCLKVWSEFGVPGEQRRRALRGSCLHHLFDRWGPLVHYVMLFKNKSVRTSGSRMRPTGLGAPPVGQGAGSKFSLSRRDTAFPAWCIWPTRAWTNDVVGQKNWGPSSVSVRACDTRLCFLRLAGSWKRSSAINTPSRFVPFTHCDLWPLLERPGPQIVVIIIWSLADFVGLPTYKEWNCVLF